MLKPVKHKKKSDQIYEQIRDMIFRGEYTPGQRLKSERDLAVLFGVGRPTVREAMLKLIDQDLIESKHGVGAFVLQNSVKYKKKSLIQILSHEDFTIVELQEARFALEARSAELAAKRATDEDILLLEKSIDRMRKEQFSDSIKMSTDISFHMNIAYASKNTVQIHLMKSFYDLQYYAMEKSYTELFSSLGIGDTIFHQHEQIVIEIKKHNPAKARKQMEEHIGVILANCLERGI